MNYEDFSELAALYSLDILDSEDCHIVEDAIANCPEWETELAELQAAVGAIPYTIPPMPISANLKNRLFQRLDPAIGTPNLTNEPLSLLTLREQAAKVSWKPYPLPGITIGEFELDMEKREVACFLRATSGVIFPKHIHAGNEEIVVLEGDLVIDGQSYGSGDRIYSIPGSAHQPATSSGCLIFVRTSLDNQIIMVS